MNIIVLQCFLEHERKVGRLCAVAVRVLAIVLEPFDGVIEGGLHEPDVLANPWKVSELEGRAVFFYDVDQRNVIEQEFVVAYFKFFLGKFEGLFDQLAIALHYLVGRLF